MAQGPLISHNGADLDINGLWNSSKACYKGVWRVEVHEGGDSLTIVEQNGVCCGFVPNCIRKRHNMKKESGTCWGITYSYKGRLGGKTVAIEIVSPTKIRHLTTDGLMILTREE